jgi:putative transposase
MYQKQPVDYRCNLPHMVPEGGSFFVTFTLEGALTREMMDNYRKNYEIALKRARLACPLKEDYDKEARRIHQEFFGKYDDHLDQSRYGSRWLEDPEIAAIVKDGLYFQDGRSWRLLAWCIMPNHVHLVADNLKAPLYRILQGMKTFTGREANLRMGRSGQAFWRRESYDHFIRDDWSLKEKIRYTIMNPVKAGLCTKWQDWPWTGLHEDIQEFILD